MNLLTALAPLGAKYKIQIVPEYSADGSSLTLAVLYSLKTDKDASSMKSLSLVGTPAEVEAALIKDLPAAVEKLATHALNLEELDKQLAADLEEKKKAAAKPAPAPQAKHTPPAKGGKIAGSKPAEALKPGAKKLEPEKGTPEASAAPLPPAGLTPAWKQPKPATPVAEVGAPAAPPVEEAGDLSSLFPSTPTA